MLEIFGLVTVLDAFSHDPINIQAPTESQQSHVACTTNQELLLVMDSQSMLTPNLQRVPELLSEENPSVQPPLQSPQSFESRLQPPRRRIVTLQFERNVRSRQSTSSVPPVPSSEEASAFSASGLEPACVKKQ